MKMIISIVLAGSCCTPLAVSMEYKTPKVKKSPSESTIPKVSVLATAREIFSRRANSAPDIKPNPKSLAKTAHKPEEAPEKPTFSQALACVKEESVCLMNDSRRKLKYDPQESILNA